MVYNLLYKKDIEIIESVLRRATRLVPKGMLVNNRYKGDAIETYKYLDGIYKVKSQSPFLLAQQGGHHTKVHDHKLTKKHCTIQLRSHFFSMRFVNLWHSLPGEVVSAPSLG